MKSDTLYQISRIPLKIQFPPSSRVLTSAFAQCNPPRSLWLQLVHRTGCFTRRAHIAVPPQEGTHGDRVAGDNTRCSHRKVSFTYYATSPAWRLRNRIPRILVLSVKLGARYGRRLATPIPSSNRHIPCIRTLRIGWNIPQPHQTNKRQRNALL